MITTWLYHTVIILHVKVVVVVDSEHFFVL